MIYKYLIIGNSSTFDTSLHYLLNLKKDNNDIEILFCTGNKNQIMNKGSYIEDFLIKNNIDCYELSDFFKINKLKFVWKKIFSNNKFNYYKKNNNFSKYFPTSFLNFLENFLGELFLSDKA